MFKIAPQLMAGLMAIATPTTLAITSLAQVESTSRFRDTASHWAAACIEGAGVQGLMKGYLDQTFRPDRTMTRAEFAAVMVKAFPEAKAVRNAPNFSDVANNFWGNAVISQAYAQGFLAGYPDNTFRPNQAISRVQAISILANALGLPVSPEEQDPFSVGFVPYSDREQIPQWAEPAVYAATDVELIVNYPEVMQLRPNDNITRGEATALLCQAKRDSSEARYRVPPQYVANDLNSMRQTFAFPPELDVQSRFIEGLAVVKLEPEAMGDSGNRPSYGYINSGGHLVLPGPYQAASEFSEGLAAVQNTAGLWGFVDRQGQWIIRPQFQNARSFSDGLAFVQQDGQSYGFIRPDGNLVFSRPLQGEVGDFSEGLIRFEQNGKWGFLDKGGEIAIPPEFEAVQDVSEGLAGVTLNGKSGFINLAGDVVIPLKYEQIQHFSQGLAAARQEATGSWGYLDPAGDWAIAPQFAVAQSFSEGLAGVMRRQSLWGFIDRTGNFVIQPEFYSPATELSDFNGPLLEPSGVKPFQDQLAVVRLGSGVGLIRPNFRQTGINGEYVRFDPIIFSDAEWASDGLIRVNAGGRWKPSNDPANPLILKGGGWGYLRVHAPKRLSSLLPRDLKGLPEAYAEAILADIQQRHQGKLPVINFQVESITPTTWNGCEGGNPAPSRPFQGVCSIEQISGWQMVVQSGPVRWVYYPTQSLAESVENWVVPAPDGPQSLPKYAADNVIRAEAREQKRPRSQYRIHWAEAVESGWRVQVINNQTTAGGGQPISTYKVGLDGLGWQRISQGEWFPPP